MGEHAANVGSESLWVRWSTKEKRKRGARRGARAWAVRVWRAWEVRAWEGGRARETQVEDRSIVRWKKCLESRARCGRLSY